MALHNTAADGIRLELLKKISELEATDYRSGGGHDASYIHDSFRGLMSDRPKRFC
jgi:hypothetical protein